jgi:hypothetical protein
MPRFRRTLRLAILVSFGASLAACTGPRGAGGRGEDARVDGSEGEDAATLVCDAGAASVDGGCEPTTPLAPDCNAEFCTGALRWTRRIETDATGDLEAPRMRFTDALSDDGIALLVEGDPSTRLEGTLLLAGAEFYPHNPYAHAVMRLDGEGALVERWPLPLGHWPGALPDGHAESLIALKRWEENGHPRFSALLPGATEPSAYVLPQNLQHFEAQRERWLRLIAPAGTEECTGAEGILWLLEHSDLHGTKLLGRGCARGPVSRQLEVLPSGGLASLLSTGLTGPPSRDADFGAGRIQLELGQHYLVVWNPDGSLRYTRPLGAVAPRIHVGGADDLWVLDVSESLTTRFRRFDADGELRNEGMTPYGGNPASLRIDSAGNGLLLGDFGPELGQLCKFSPTGEVIWTRALDGPIDLESLRVDTAGRSYVLSGDGRTLYQLEP